MCLICMLICGVASPDSARPTSSDRAFSRAPARPPDSRVGEVDRRAPGCVSSVPRGRDEGGTRAGFSFRFLRLGGIQVRRIAEPEGAMSSCRGLPESSVTVHADPSGDCSLRRTRAVRKLKWDERFAEHAAYPHPDTVRVPGAVHWHCCCARPWCRCRARVTVAAGRRSTVDSHTFNLRSTSPDPATAQLGCCFDAWNSPSLPSCVLHLTLFKLGLGQRRQTK
ncbi:hypothetical protein K466DRAFT_248584 [Polyporus arcularius HHB13444]|uniref:Secreted protein n=1 Tax=Polyporus arcularius HHB13444 TaxID=1314778 RepID=A0A5C3PSU9_9APHY|nr:hypothetical protein K466DRAFT_248584 [Polyporus arcularius HHB13444]